MLIISGQTLAKNASPEGLSIEGHIFNKETQEAVLYATVMIKNTTIGTTTDETGSFIIRNLKPGKYTLVVSCLGYKTLETQIELKNDNTPHIHLNLEPHAVTIDEVVVSANRNETSRKEAPVIVNVLSTKQFEKNNAQDLVQALPFQSGVRVEYNCQNCGFPQVKINGLDGPYTQILIDSRPVMSALSGVYGLEQIPVNMVERVEVVKGGGSALFGANAIAGTINIITKEPTTPSLSVGTDVQMIGGSSYAQNVNVNGALLSKDKKTGASFYQTYRTRSAYDADKDGFTELGELENLSFGTNIFYNIDNRNKEINNLKQLISLEKEYTETTDVEKKKNLEEKILDILIEDIKKIVGLVDWIFDTFIDVILARKDLWDKLGQTIGEIINTVVSTIKAIVDRIKPEEIWDAFSRLFQNTVFTIDWGQMHETVKEIAQKLADFWNAMFGDDGFWNALQKVINEGINLALDFVIEFGKNFKFKDAADRIIEELDKLLRTFPYERLKEAVS